MAIAAFFATPLLLGQEAAWMNLGHIDHGNTYFVILRNGTCVQGKIQSVKPDSLLVAEPNSSVKANPNVVAAPRLVTVARLDAREVKDGYNEYDILYSGRSSWRDVRGVASSPPSRERLSITLKSGKSVSGKPAGSTDSQLSTKAI